MAIIGTHVLVYTPEAEACREVLRDVFGLPHVDAGEGWLIFGLPPAEMGVHPSEGSTRHEITLMCDDLAGTMAELAAEGVEFKGEPEDQGFGLVATMVLPGGVEMLLYEPCHPTAI